MDIFSAELAGLFTFRKLAILPLFSRSGLPSSVCPKCRSEITGRAHDTEQFLLNVPAEQGPRTKTESDQERHCDTSQPLFNKEERRNTVEMQGRPVKTSFESLVSLQAGPQLPRNGTPKTSKRVTWSPSVQK